MAGTILKETGASSDIVPAPQDYASRLAALLAIDDSKVSLIQELITEHSAQQSVINSLKLELEDERDTKEKWRGRFMEREKDVESMNRNPYVVMLVDGDGMIFTDELLYSGGPNAAAALLKHARAIASSSPSFSSSSAANSISASAITDSLTVLIRVFSNVSALSQNLPFLPGSFPFRDFTIGFSQPRALIDWIDVGPGKEMADSKISGELNFHLKNENCKMVMLAASHDNGYARVLSSILADGVEVERVVLLEGGRVGKEFQGLPFRRVKLGGVFREGYPSQNTSGAGSGGGQGHNAFRQKNLPEGPPPPYTTPPTPVPPSQPKQGKKDRTIYPAPIPRPSVALLHRVGAIKPAPCYIHYLAPWACPSGQKCTYNHTYQFSQEEFSALKFLAQGGRCKDGIACKNIKCFYGHRCQVMGVCDGVGCVFKKEEHGEGQYKPTVPTKPGGPKAGSAKAGSAKPGSAKSDAGNAGGKKKKKDK